ncbi:MAG: DUF1538 domain-containing protein [Alphaproteobacteria bacterium]|nr:DUF1538 domain-containing protein [Alphaproteobacteria bacterium]
MDILIDLFWTAAATIRDVIPIAVVLFGFQYLVIRRPLPHLRTIVIGFIYVVAGLTFFLVGLEQALFPLGKLMAKQLTDPAFIHGIGIAVDGVRWQDYYWVYLFAASIGFASTIAEPSLIAIAIKANQASGGVIGIWGLRIAVAVGVAIGVALGAYRIITGTPLHYYIIVGYAIVIIQTTRANRAVIPLAYDSGGVTTSTVTVPLVTALGLGLATTIPGRSPLIDGFGLIAFASLFPIITVMGYAQFGEWLRKRRRLKGEADEI